MKVGADSFSLTQLATVIVPGAITCAAVALAVRPSCLLNVTTEWPEWQIKFALWLVGFALLVAVVLFGMVIGSFSGVLEATVLDPQASRRLNISRGVYDHQWHAYLATLPEHRNPYITKLVDFFQFESRTAISLLLLTISVTHQFGLNYWAPFLMLFLTYGMYRLGTETHFELARYRHHMYRFHMEVAGSDLTPVPELASWDGSLWHATLWEQPHRPRSLERHLATYTLWQLLRGPRAR